MAGGSGAGMFLDVADILRAADPADWCDSSLGIMYTADVFSDIPELGRQGVMPNSLAALCELMNGYWNNAAPGPEYRVLERKGIPVAGFQRRGVRYPLLVGRSNDSVQLRSQLGVYEACAKTLAAFMTSPTAQNSITSYLEANWESSSQGITDTSPFKDSVKGTVVSAMGMGSLSLGRDRFARYASQRLARAAVEHALRFHTIGRKVPGEITFEAARDEAAVSYMDWFVQNCGLDEIGESRNQVLDQLRPISNEPAAAVEAAISAQVVQFGELQPKEYAQLIVQTAHERHLAYVSATDQLMRERAAQWAPNVTHWIRSATLEAISRAGLEVTVELLRRLVDHVGDVINDLSTEVPRLEGKAARLDKAVHGTLQSFGAAAMTSDNELLPTARHQAVRALEFGSEARLRQMATELLNDLNRNEITPLAEAARRALSELRTDEFPPEGRPTVGIGDWPVGNIVPDALQPAMNERLVEETVTFPASYQEQIVATARRPDQPNERLAPLAAEWVAVGEILTGRATDMTSDDVVVTLSDWWPQYLSSLRPAATARYELRFGGLAILDRAEDWVHRRNTAFGEFVHQSLRTYVEHDDPGERVKRRERVLGAFREVLGVASPLVEVNNMLFQAVHETKLASQFHFTAVPFKQSDLEAELVAIAETAGLTDNALADLARSMGMGDEQRIEIITTLEAPIQPVTLQSVMEPIAKQWVRSRDNKTDRDYFWRWRRARALPEFIPASPEVILAMVRGWFLGRLIGELNWDKTQVSTTPIRIYDAEFKRDVAFPFPYLGGQPTSEQDLLPAVLESMPISMLESQALGSTDPMECYSLLRSLGEESSLHIRNWIQYGITPHGTTPLDRAWRHPEFVGSTASEATPRDRQQAVLTYLHGRMQTYVERLDAQPVGRANLETQPRWLDLRDQLAAAFDALSVDAESVYTDEVEDGGD
ncbi:MAG: tubulin-like doman-containing protein [Microthrixaceae bacterium]